MPPEIARLHDAAALVQIVRRWRARQDRAALIPEVEAPRRQGDVMLGLGLPPLAPMRWVGTPFRPLWTDPAFPFTPVAGPSRTVMVDPDGERVVSRSMTAFWTWAAMLAGLVLPQADAALLERPGEVGGHGAASS